MSYYILPARAEVAFVSVGRQTGFVPFLGGSDVEPLKLPWLPPLVI